MLRLVVGARQAERVLFGGAMYLPEEAREIGLVDAVVAADRLPEEARAAAAGLAARDPAAFASIKRLLRGPTAQAMVAHERDSISSSPRLVLAGHAREAQGDHDPVSHVRSCFDAGPILDTMGALRGPKQARLNRACGKEAAVTVRLILLGLVGLLAAPAWAEEPADLEQTITDLSSQTGDKERIDRLGATKVEVNQIRTWLTTARLGEGERGQGGAPLLRPDPGADELVDQLISLSQIDNEAVRLERESPRPSSASPR